MSEYDIGIANETRHLHIRKRDADDVPRYLTESYTYGEEYVDEGSYVTITTDIRTCEILDISHVGMLYGCCACPMWDTDELDAEEEKPKASFVAPKDDDGMDPDDMRGYTSYYAQNAIKILLEDGEVHYRYCDDRLVLYYDEDKTLLTIFIDDVTEEEYERLAAKHGSHRRSF